MAINAALEILGVHTEHTGFVAAGGSAPAITSDATPDVNTGDTAVVTVTATGTGTKIFSIVGGADAGSFSINASTGALAFLSASVDGSYSVIVAATSDWGIARQTITVTVAGGGSYTASAVHFAGATQLGIASLTTTDSGYQAFSGWQRIPGGLSQHGGVFAADPANSYSSSWFTPLGSCDWELLNFDDSSALMMQIGSIVHDEWIHILGAMFTDVATGARLGSLYIDDTLAIGPNDFLLNTGSAFIPLLNGLAFYIGNDNANNWYTGDLADFWYAPVNLLEPDGTISVANRRKFIDGSGKPVNPTNFPASPMLFSGDASAFGDNQGPGGVFTLTGPLSNATKIASAAVVDGGQSWFVGDTFSIDGGLGAPATGAVLTITPSRFTAAITGIAIETSNPVTAVVQGAKTFAVSGDVTATAIAPVQFNVTGSTGNDGTYTVVSAVFGAAHTVVTVAEAIPSAIADGNIIISGVITVAGNHAASVVGPNKIIVSGSSGPVGPWPIQFSAFSGGNTQIYLGLESGLTNPTVGGSIETSGAIATLSLTYAGMDYPSGTTPITATSGPGASGATVSVTNASSSPSD